MTDATSRAREAWQAERILATIADALLSDHEAMDCMEQAETIVASLNAVDFQIIDTRTHVAVPREPSDEVVERVARAICYDEIRPTYITVPGVDPDPEYVWLREREAARNYWRESARAAIAAMTQETDHHG